MSLTYFPPLDDADLKHVYESLDEKTWRELLGRRIFLTGGTGFVGKWLLATLIDIDRRIGLGCHVTVLSRDPEAFSKAAPHLAGAEGVQLVQGDVRVFDFPVGRFDIVIHAATDVIAKSSPQAIFATCNEGTQRVLDFAAHCGAKELLLVSSGAVYGRQPPTLERVSEAYAGAPDPLLPSSAYGEGKRVSEWLVCARAAESSLSVKIARCFAFIGPYMPLDKQFAIGNFLRSAMVGEEIVIQGDGSPHRSYLHASDMAAWLWAVLLRGQSGAAYNVGGEEIISISALAERICRVLACAPQITLQQRAEPSAMPTRYVPDISLACNALGLPQPLSLDEAIMRTARWHAFSLGRPLS